MARAAVAALVLALACVARAQTQTTTPSYVPDTLQPQTSVNYDVMFNGYQGPTEVIPFSDPLVAVPANLGPVTPWSVHVTLAEGAATGSVWVSWSTGLPANATNPAQTNESAPGADIYVDDFPQAPTYQFNPKSADPGSVASVVEWGTATGVYGTNTTGTARSYIQSYLFSGITAVTQLFHHVHVTGIPYGRTIYYRVGDPAQTGGLSAEFTLTLNASLAPFTANYPVRVGMLADVGTTYNSSITYQHLVAHNPDFAMFMGDLSYADDWTSTGIPNGAIPLPTFALTGRTEAQTYQPRWDSMTQLLQNVGAGTSLPYMFLPGNHEIERDEQLLTFQSFMNRFRSPYEQSLSTNPLYYSLDVGPIHIIMLNAYGGLPGNLTINTNNTAQQAAAELGNNGAILNPNGNYPYSSFGYNQLSWFLNDIGRVDRGRTPWVIVAWHQPPYNSYSTHYKEFECGRQQIEPFLYANGVDIVMHGHVHAYERTYPVNNYAVDQCGMRWITIGDGGNIEGLYKTYAAQNGTCFCTPVNNATYSNGCPCASVLPNGVPQACTTTQNGLFAPVNGTQPSYSAYREPSFGHGILNILSPTQAQWTWYRNQDGEPVASDSALFTRNTAACPNKLQPRYTPPATAAPTTTPRGTTTPAPSAAASPTPAPTTTLGKHAAVANAILNNPIAQGIENHINAATSAVNALP